MAQLSTVDKYQTGLTPEVSDIINTSIGTVGDLANTGIELAVQAGTSLAEGAMTMGIGPILSGVGSVLNAIGGLYNGIVAANQKGTTERTGIIASLIADLKNVDTNKTSNIAFVIMGGVVMMLLLLIAMKKQMK